MDKNTLGQPLSIIQMECIAEITASQITIFRTRRVGNTATLIHRGQQNQHKKQKCLMATFI